MITNFPQYSGLAYLCQLHEENHTSAPLEILISSLANKLALQYCDEEGNYPFLSYSYRSDLPRELVTEDVESDFSALVNLANKWREAQKEFLTHCLNADQIKHLEEIKMFPTFLKKLLVNEKLRGRFLTYVVLQENRIEPFVKFPHTVEKLSKAYLLTSRIGFINNQWPKIENRRGRQRLTLPWFEDKKTTWIDISDPNDTVVFNQKKYTSSEIISIFKDKNVAPGELEFSVQGIRYWKSHKIQIADVPDWWEQLPVIKKFSSSEELLSYLKIDAGKLPLDPKTHFIVLEGTHKSDYISEERIQLLNAHFSYSLIYPSYPNKDKTRAEHYNLATVSFTSDVFPRDNIDYSIIAFTAALGTIKSPDENVFHTERERERIVFAVTQNHFSACLEKLKRQFKLDLKDELYFQYGSYNCSDWAMQMLGEFFEFPEIELLKHSLTTTIFNFKFDGLTKKVFQLLEIAPASFVRILNHSLTHMTLINPWFKSRIEFLKVSPEKSYEKGKRYGDKGGEVFHPERLITRSKKNELCRWIDLQDDKRPIEFNYKPEKKVAYISMRTLSTCTRCIAAALIYRISYLPFPTLNCVKEPLNYVNETTLEFV